MWATERAHRLAMQPLRWAGDTDPGTCERCGAEGAVPTHLFNTRAWAYDLCAMCRMTLLYRLEATAAGAPAWARGVMFASRVLWQ
jgi:hypothetical protein